MSVITLAALSWASLVTWVADEPPTRTGLTFYVSKLGDNSDGRTWKTAYNTIQAALLAIPDDEGGHSIIIRPDRYVEANLYPAFKGAPGAYNTLEGDFDGKRGSGATGWVVLDSGVPDRLVRTNPNAPTGNPTFMESTTDKMEYGLKSVDWWGPWKCDPDFSAVIWDRWIYRHIYSSGSEGGIGWDLTSQAGSEFSALVEDCVGIGRFAGAAVIGHVGRKDEPVLFRNSYFACLDVWGDAGALYLRSHNKAMPEFPDAIFEDCAFVGPDNAVQIGYPSFEGYTRAQFTRCKLIVLNFSQPNGVPSTGVIYSDLAGKFFHADLQDCDLMGYKPFGVREGDPFTYSVKGNVRAYVQYRQETPPDIERVQYWPVETFSAIAPPVAPATHAAPPAPEIPRLTKLPVNFGEGRMENTPVEFNGQQLLVQNIRPATGKKDEMFLIVNDLRTGVEVARFGQGFSFASAFVNGGELNVFATEYTDDDWTHDIFRFTSKDLKNWTQERIITREGDQHFFNASVCQDPQGYVMAYESNVPVQWTFQFARSKDLATWEKVEGICFADTKDKGMSACPAIRYIDPYYYVIYSIARNSTIGQKFQYELPETAYVSILARSKDLALWEISPSPHPLTEPSPGEGLNSSDCDLFEFNGNTYIYYATGDQMSWGTVRVAMYPGPMKTLFEQSFPAGVPCIQFDARQGAYLFPGDAK